MKSTARSSAPRQGGFTLIEVLVAVLVLAVGVIGMAGLQFASLRSNQQSYQRGQAAALAGELSDLMRANRVAAGNGSYLLALNTVLTVPATSCVTTTTSGTAPAPCSSANIAAEDLYDWQTRVLAALPGAKTRVACSVASCSRGVMQTVTVMWDENRTGAAGTSCPNALTFNPATDLACYSLSLTP